MTARALTKGTYESRFSELVEAVGGAERAGVLTAKSGKQIKRYESGESEPPFEVVARLAAEAGRSLDWLVGATPAPASIAGSDLVRLPHFATRPSAGGGAVASSDDQADGTVAFSSGWLRLIGVNPRRAHVLTAKGDSMEPTIRDGDLLIVDRSIDRVVDAGIYVVTVGGMVVVKRVQVNRDGTLILRSDNGRYHDEVIPADELYTITIEGRVCWSGRPM